MPVVDIRLCPEPLDVAAAVKAVTCAEAGGIDVFLGTTRAQQDPQMGELAALDYQAYDEMALREIRRLVDQACAQWPVHRIVVWHRIGSVIVGEPSIIIAVSCPHRSEAFAACRFVIDQLKETVPIWKKEVFAQAARWQGQ